MVDGTGLEQHGHAAGGVTNTPVGCLLVRGSQCVGMSTKKDAARPLVWILFCGGGTGREPGQAKAGYHHEGDILPFDILNKAWYTRLSSTNRDLTKECDYMGKAILAAIVTLIVGYLGMVVGLELLGNWVEFGLLIAIAVMGAFIIYFNDKK